MIVEIEIVSVVVGEELGCRVVGEMLVNGG